jgi:DNA-binding MarR family transcriptional regulator
VATRVIDSVEKLGMVRRVSDPTDGRACLIELTDEGHRTLSQLWSTRAAVLTKRIGRLSPEQASALAAALPALEALTRDTST